MIFVEGQPVSWKNQPLTEHYCGGMSQIEPAEQATFEPRYMNQEIALNQRLY